MAKRNGSKKLQDTYTFKSQCDTMKLQSMVIALEKALHASFPEPLGTDASKVGNVPIPMNAKGTELLFYKGSNSIAHRKRLLSLFPKLLKDVVELGTECQIVTRSAAPMRKAPKKRRRRKRA